MRNSEFVVLPGLTLPVEPVLLALDLERRGCRLTVDGDVLHVGPGAELTDDDRVAIRRWKLHLMAIVSYRADEDGRLQ